MNEYLFSITTTIDKHDRSSDVITTLHNYKIVQTNGKKMCNTYVTCPITNKKYIKLNKIYNNLGLVVVCQLENLWLLE